MTSATKTFSLRTYRAMTSLLAPIARIVLGRRLKVGKEDPARVTEREGIAGIVRPEGKLIWIHGASVGESLSVLPLIDRLLADHPSAHILVTTGTVTSAGLMAARLPPRAIHQYAPVDQPEFVNRFLNHWRPDAALFIESELWPVILGEMSKRNIPLGLVNGRVSPKSYAGWKKRPSAARELLDTFDVILAQDENNAARLSELAGRKALTCGNLKRAAPPLPLDKTALVDLSQLIGPRPIWLAASTHPGEEKLVLEAHRQVKATTPNILTIIAPRHPARGDAVAAILREANISFAQRSTGTTPTADTEIYLADTLGELGIFYRLSNVAFIGGSLLEIGGHNPMEPARLGSAIVTGPHVFNFKETFDEMRNAGALALVRNERDLSGALLRLIGDERTRTEMARRAQEWADFGGQAVLNEIVSALSPVFDQSLSTQ